MRLALCLLAACAAPAVSDAPDYASGGKADAPDAPPHARLVFAAGFTQHREGVLAPGGELTIAYDNARLPDCRDQRNGYELWDITAHVRFEPGGEQRDVSVRGSEPTIPVPADTRRAVLWFENTGVSGCRAWDSNYGANYPFDAQTPPQWVGDQGSLITRDDTTSRDICGRAQDVTFDTWARQRATITNLCFSVYEPGLTDHDDPDLWQKLDVSLHWSGGVVPVNFDRRVGNNARYAFSWRTIDPFRAFHCPEVATTADANDVHARIDYYISVNGYELRPAPGEAYRADFSDYVGDPWRAANCP